MTRGIQSWIVPLQAHAFDAEDLCVYLTGHPVTVQQRDGSYFLLLPVALTGPTGEHVGSIAAEYIARINGAASVAIEGFRPIAVGDGAYHGIDAEGRVISTGLHAGTGEFRLKGGHATFAINGVVQRDGRLGQLALLLKAAETSAAMADALAIVGRQFPTWSELYLAFELVEANTGDQMYSKGWIERAEKNLFTRTANSYTALGRAGRHGKNSGAPPSTPMPQAVAIRLMRKLVAAWLGNTECGQHGG